MILDYLKYKLEVPAYEWRRILKVRTTNKYLGDFFFSIK